MRDGAENLLFAIMLGAFVLCVFAGIEIAPP